MLNRGHAMGYDSIGKTYTRTRHADPRITRAILDALDLPSGSRVVDVGAGTGNDSGCAFSGIVRQSLD